MQSRGRVLFAWELGGGLGHVLRMRPLVQRLAERGYSCSCLAIRHEDTAKHLPCPVEEAPWLRFTGRTGKPWVGHIGDTLAALGWSDPGHLSRAVGRWREVLEQKRPDMLVMDSAPVALLASQGLPIKRVWLADAWNTPPQHRPLPDMRERLLNEHREVADTEPGVVHAVNQVLAETQLASIENLSGLFRRAEFSAMLAMAELDPFGPRADTVYRGVWGVHAGAVPDWPTSRLGPGAPGVFCYLNPFVGRHKVVRLLAATGLPTIAMMPNLQPTELAEAKGASVTLIDQPIDASRLFDQCAFVVGQGSPTFTGLALKAGVPSVAIPQSLEQLAIARAAEQTGAVAVAHATKPETIRQAMHRVLTDPRPSQAAKTIAQRYTELNPEQAAICLADEIADL